MAQIDSLLKQARSDDKKEREDAAKSLRDVVTELGDNDVDKIREVILVLEELTNDKEKKVKKEAEKSLPVTKDHLNKMESSTDTWGSSTTEDEWGTSTDDSAGEWGTTESKKKKDTPMEEKALEYHFKEELKGTLLYSGELTNIETKGTLEVKNLGTSDRVWDINFSMLEKGSTDLEESYHINEIQPTESWTKEYQYQIESDIETAPLKFSEEIDTNKETEEPSTILVFKQVMKTRLRYKFKTNRSLNSIKMVKSLPAGFSEIEIMSPNIGEAKEGTGEDGNSIVTWEIPQVAEGQEGELVIEGAFDVQDFETINSGTVQVTYDSKDSLLSAAKIADERTANVRSYQTIDTEEIDNKPDFWKSLFTFKNDSEFPIRLTTCEISGDEVKEDETENKTFLKLENPIVVSSGQEWKSEEWESYAQKLPEFTKTVEFTVDSVIVIHSESVLDLEPIDLIVANIEARKVYLNEDGEEISDEVVDVPSHREKPMPALIEIKNVGKIKYENVTITEDIPEHFLPAKNETLQITYVDPDGKETILDERDFEYRPEDDDNPDNGHQTELKIWRDCEPDGKFLIRYDPRAVKARHDYEGEYITKTHIQAAIQDSPSLTYDIIDEAPKLNITHFRRRVSIGKTVLPGSRAGQYEIQMIFINKRDDLNDVVLKDFIPDEFEFSDCEITLDGETIDCEIEEENASFDGDDGILKQWKFPEIKTDSRVLISFRLSGKEGEHYHASKAQMSYV